MGFSKGKLNQLSGERSYLRYIQGTESSPIYLIVCYVSGFSLDMLRSRIIGYLQLYS